MTMKTITEVRVQQMITQAIFRIVENVCAPYLVIEEMHFYCKKKTVRWSEENNGCGSETDSSEMNFSTFVRTRSGVYPLI